MIILSNEQAVAVIKELQRQIDLSDDAIKEMRTVADKALEKSRTEETERLHGAYMDRLTELEENVTEYYTRLIEALHNSGWIDIRKQRPEPMTPCLMATESVSFEAMMSAEGKVIRNGSDDYEEALGERVVGWMPVPDPPEL